MLLQITLNIVEENNVFYHDVEKLLNKNLGEQSLL